jgi:hypothetical protein
VAALAVIVIVTGALWAPTEVAGKVTDDGDAEIGGELCPKLA